MTPQPEEHAEERARPAQDDREDHCDRTTSANGKAVMIAFLFYVFGLLLNMSLKECDAGKRRG